MINKKQIKEIIDETLFAMGDRFFSRHASDLVFETGLVESRYEYLRQLGDGPAQSFWQIEPATAVDNVKNYLSYRNLDTIKIAEATHVHIDVWQSENERTWEEVLRYNIASAIAHCRIKYWRVPEKLPTNLEERAKYWKKFYNSGKGKGTESHYIEIVEAYDK
tara:strand:- start:455 stop:943 length:489 start_codon:yes stop_codon:yes gene_type:complete